MKITKAINYVVVKTLFYGGGIASVHKTLEAAKKAEKRYERKHSNSNIPCAFCRVVTVDKYNALPHFDDIFDDIDNYGGGDICKA